MYKRQDYDPATSNYLYYNRTLSTTDTLYDKVSNGSYVEVTPKSRTQKPIITFNVWGTLAGEYNVKIVFLPQTRAAAKGKIKENLFDVKKAVISNQGDLANSPFAYDLAPNPLKMDTVDVGTVKLARSVYGKEMVGLKLTLESYGELNGEERSTTYLIDCIILEPSKK